MIIRHWSAHNGSGMHHVAAQCAQAERQLGHESLLMDIAKPDSWAGCEHADIHVLHTNIPEAVRAYTVKPFKYVFVAHGTPEVIMQSAVDEGDRPNIYAPMDGWMLLKQNLRVADAVVTFWDRHRWLYQAMLPKERQVHLVPLGVDREFWAGGTLVGKYAGEPSVWTSENQHRIKWMLDIITYWPDVLQAVPGARLHAHSIPHNLHRFFIDYANSNGTAYGAFLSGVRFEHKDLRNIWKGFDYFLSPVRHGDHNNIFMQAAAAGVKTVSYVGNVYADHWIPEGDQRFTAKELVRIFKGEAEPRADKLPVPDLKDMGEAMVRVYEGVLA